MSPVLFAVLKKHPKVFQVVRATVIVGLYTTWALLYYGTMEGWTYLDAIYYAVVTMSTVGYGDFSPSKDSPIEMFVTILFIFAYKNRKVQVVAITDCGNHLGKTSPDRVSLLGTILNIKLPTEKKIPLQLEFKRLHTPNKKSDINRE